MQTAVVAIGGNALVRDNQHDSIEEEIAAAHRIARSLADLTRDFGRLVLTHGNGPQVGFILRRSELAASVAPELQRIGLEISVADSQGGIGHMLAVALMNELRGAGREPRVAGVITHCVVAADDPAFGAPSKPIGSWYGEERARALEREWGWTMVQDSGRGWRRVVPSPRPLRILEQESVAALLQHGFIVIAAGGGGIPVVEEGGRYRGVDAVIDKDLASALLAAGLGADLLVITTAVDQVALDYGRPRQRWLDAMTAAEAERHLAEGQFPAGSMGPKVEAALQYLRAGGSEVLITSPKRLGDALAGRTGTRILKG